MKTPPFWFASVLRRYSRIAIAGGPRTGKTTLAESVTDRPVFGTDDLMSLPWEDVPRAVIAKSRELGDAWVIEGVQVARALRKGLRPQVVVEMTGAKVPRTVEQESMSKAVGTVLREWVVENPGRVVVEGSTFPGGPR